MYYHRYAVVKKGFVAESIDDFGYLLELVNATHDFNYEEIQKVIDRMKAQGLYDVNETDNDGVTTLIAASFRGHEKLVDLLMQDGADHSATAGSGETALIK